MSWSAFKQDVARDALDDIQPVPPLDGEPAEQFAQAKAAAAALIDSGVVGDPARHRFHVSLSGHANPAHEPQEGFGNDLVTVSISQALAVADES